MTLANVHNGVSMQNGASPETSSICSDKVDVRMIELVTSAHTTDGKFMDAKSLLKLMDICTCAAAEKHTKVNCVTVSMGDVIFDYFPECGDLLELTARTVFTGTTSLDISLTVIAEGEGGVLHEVCEAIFTYVTTKGPNGEKQLCPPLQHEHQVGYSEKYEWEIKVAQHRRSLITMERKNSRTGIPDDNTAVCNTLKDRFPGFDLEMTEVVLPPHQNHMGHTFGGVVMAWMAKAALAVAARKALRRSGSLFVRSVLRVDFKCGSEVSDHVIFRSRLNAVFDEGRSAEVEVRVSKRSLSTGEETGMNVGYFYISGSAVGTGTDIPFSPEKVFRKSQSDKEMCKIREEAEWRRTQLLARRQLLAGMGGAVEWHLALQDEASLLTVKSVLRLVHHRDCSVNWHEIPVSTVGLESVQWTPGEAWRRNDTFVLRIKGLLPTGLLSGILETLRAKRPKWDNHCASIDVLEESTTQKSIQWDIVCHTSIAPNQETVPLCLFRTWQVDESTGTAILASQSVQHDKAKNVSAQVRPSGWFLHKSDLSHSGIELTYIVEHDLVPMRKLFPNTTDRSLVQMMSEIAVGWFDRLRVMNHDAS